MKALKIFFISILCFINYAHAKGTLKIKSNINDAYIYLNGKKKAMLGEGTTSLQLKEGEYIVEIRKITKDKKYIYKGEKNIFVGDSSSSLVNIPTKKYYYKIKKKSNVVKNLGAEQKKQLLEKFIMGYYSNINNKTYSKNYYLVTSKYKKTPHYSKYLNYWADEIKHVSVLSASNIEMNKTNDRAKITINLGYVKNNNTTFCKNTTLGFIYKNKWFLDSQVDNDCKPFIYEKKEESSLMRIEIPPYYVKDEYVKIKVTLKNLKGLKKGGLSVSFPSELFIKNTTSNRKTFVKDVATSFTSKKLYMKGDKAWNRIQKKSIALKYPLYEGWTNNWVDKTEETLYFTIKPTSRNGLYLFFRSILLDSKNNEYSNPKYGISDQQGYNAQQLVIPILHK